MWLAQIKSNDISHDSDSATTCGKTRKARAMRDTTSTAIGSAAKGLEQLRPLLPSSGERDAHPL